MPTGRRSFLGTAAAGAAAGFAIATLFAAGASSRPGPNDTISIGLIGCAPWTLDV